MYLHESQVLPLEFARVDIETGSGEPVVLNVSIVVVTFLLLPESGMAGRTNKACVGIVGQVDDVTPGDA